MLKAIQKYVVMIVMPQLQMVVAQENGILGYNAKMVLGFKKVFVSQLVVVVILILVSLLMVVLIVLQPMPIIVLLILILNYKCQILLVL